MYVVFNYILHYTRPPVSASFRYTSADHTKRQSYYFSSQLTLDLRGILFKNVYQYLVCKNLIDLIDAKLFSFSLSVEGKSIDCNSNMRGLYLNLRTQYTNN